jgi:hypothetical protein
MLSTLFIILPAFLKMACTIIIKMPLILALMDIKNFFLMAHIIAIIIILLNYPGASSLNFKPSYEIL